MAKTNGKTKTAARARSNPYTAKPKTSTTVSALLGALPDQLEALPKVKQTAKTLEKEEKKLRKLVTTSERKIVQERKRVNKAVKGIQKDVDKKIAQAKTDALARFDTLLAGVGLVRMSLHEAKVKAAKRPRRATKKKAPAKKTKATKTTRARAQAR